MIDNVESEFLITPNRKDAIYQIESTDGRLLALIYRTYRFKETAQKQMNVIIEYELQYNVCKQFSISEKRMINNYFHNMVTTLTRDIQTIYDDNIDERMSLPFYENILRVKAVK